MRGSDFALQCPKCQREPLHAESVGGVTIEEGTALFDHISIDYVCPVGHVVHLNIAHEDGAMLNVLVLETPQEGVEGNIVGEPYDLKEALRLIPDEEWDERWG